MQESSPPQGLGRPRRRKLFLPRSRPPLHAPLALLRRLFPLGITCHRPHQVLTFESRPAPPPPPPLSRDGQCNGCRIGCPLHDSKLGAVESEWIFIRNRQVPMCKADCSGEQGSLNAGSPRVSAPSRGLLSPDSPTLAFRPGVVAPSGSPRQYTPSTSSGNNVREQACSPLPPLSPWRTV